MLGTFDTFVKKHDYDNPKFVGKLNEYLMYVPQKVGVLPVGGIAFSLATPTRSPANPNCLTNWSPSVSSRQATSGRGSRCSKWKSTQTFNVVLKVLEDKKTIAEIQDFYKKGVNRQHVLPPETSAFLRTAN